MAFMDSQGFSPLSFDQASRAQVQTGYSQQPAVGSGVGSFLGNLMSIGAAVTPFIPGAQVAAPFLAAGAGLMNGNITGAVTNASAGMQGLQKQATTDGGGGTTTPPAENTQEETETPEITNPTEDNDAYVDPAFSSQQEYDQWLNQYFMQDPFQVMLAYQSGQFPGMGFNQFQ